MNFKNRKIKLFFIISFTSILFLIVQNYSDLTQSFTQIFKSNNTLVYESSCECLRNKKILVIEKNASFLDIYESETYSRSLLYSVPKAELNDSTFTCDMYSSLRRGKHQKVISYTLFGKDRLYYDKLRNVSKQIKKFYPGWLMRVYHDASIDTSIICDVQCQIDEDGKDLSRLIDNVDFCDLSHFKVNRSGRQLAPYEYVLPRMWRFLAVGDSFIDIVMSRDSDSYILKREVDAVDDWLKSDKLFHIMRDHPEHGTSILGGMWGMKTFNDRTFSDKIFNLAVDPKVMKSIDPYNTKFKEGDQVFLRQYVFNLIKHSALVHDSYLCNLYGGLPFPSKRQGDCFVGSGELCNLTATFRTCPVECRPKDHQDWTTC